MHEINYNENEGNHLYKVFEYKNNVNPNRYVFFKTVLFLALIYSTKFLGVSQ